MPPSTEIRNPKRLAHIAGALYVALIPTGVLGLLYLKLNVLVPGDGAATVARLLAAEGMVRLSAASGLVAQLVNVALVLLLYVLLRPAHRVHALLMVVFSLLAVPIAFLTEAAKLLALHTAAAGVEGGGLPSGLVQMQTLAWLAFYRYGTTIAGVYWGLWLFPMGWCVYRSGYLPRIIGVLLMIGCFGYFFDSFRIVLLPDWDVSLAEFLFIGELAMAFWLLIRGVNVEKWNEAVKAAAS